MSFDYTTPKGVLIEQAIARAVPVEKICRDLDVTYQQVQEAWRRIQEAHNPDVKPRGKPGRPRKVSAA